MHGSEQIIRPTGLLDPEITVNYQSKVQIDDLSRSEIRKTLAGRK